MTSFIDNKGRHTVCKLSNGQAWFVRNLAGRVKRRELARYFGVHINTIYTIRKAMIYQDLVLDAVEVAEIERLRRLFKV